MNYIENPKTKGSGIMCCIPQEGTCPHNCPECFFQSGRSYLEPLEENLPNMPSKRDMMDRVLRVNDGNDSDNDREAVIDAVEAYPSKFYNTSFHEHLDEFDAPVVLTVNPAEYTDESFAAIPDIPKNLMFVRVRTNMWNVDDVVYPAVEYYTELEVPVVLTFMAYFEEGLHEGLRRRYDYVWRKRTTNSYFAITTEAWERTMARFKYNPWVHSCGKIEGEKGVTACRHCGNCLREYFATMERMRIEG